jgi:tetratricopeptide (TPR) repeat protein
MGDNAAAETQFRQLTRIEPDNPDFHAELAGLLAVQGKSKEALAERELLARLNPSGPSANHADFHLHIGILFARLGDMTSAVGQWREALRLKPGWQLPMNNIAWIRATARDATFRNGAEAVQWAESALRTTTNASPETLGTLAAAYAENGQWPKAVESAQTALAMAQASTNKTLSGELIRQLDSYRTNQPWRE